MNRHLLLAAALATSLLPLPASAEFDFDGFNDQWSSPPPSSAGFSRATIAPLGIDRDPGSMGSILPQGGGVPSFYYERPGSTTILTPGEPPTFIYPGRGTSPTVIIDGHGRSTYIYTTR